MFFFNFRNFKHKPRRKTSTSRRTISRKQMASIRRRRTNIKTRLGREEKGLIFSTANVVTYDWTALILCRSHQHGSQGGDSLVKATKHRDKEFQNIFSKHGKDLVFFILSLLNTYIC